MSHKRVTGLSKLIRALQNAVIKAQDLVRTQHLETLKNHLNEDGTAKTVKVLVPVPEAGEGAHREINVPELTLMPTGGLKIDKLKMAFDVELSGLDHDEDDDCGHEMSIEMRRGLFSRSTTARVELTFKGEDAPEGYMKLNDELEKFL